MCVESLANCDCVSPLHRAMKLRKDLLVVVCETFNRMFAYNHDSLVSQALSCGLVKDLLNILNSRLDNIPNASSCKAQVCLSCSSLFILSNPILPLLPLVLLAVLLLLLPHILPPDQVVKALKAMQRSLVYGDQVTQLLNASPVWKDYEKQKHDLFLDNEKPLALTQVTTTSSHGWRTVPANPDALFVAEFHSGIPDDEQADLTQHAAAHRGQPRHE